MRATTDFQGNIPMPSDYDIVICILWSRLGSALNEKYRRADGTPYASGTEYEFEDATQARQLKGKPELLVYRNRQQPMIPIEPEKERNEKIGQFEALQTFLKRWFLNPDGTVRIATNDYDNLAVFEEKLERNLRVLIEEAAAPLSGHHGHAVLPRTYAKGSPFRQLRPFEFADADIFFGRTKAIDDVLTAMREQAAEGTAFTLILGSSGSGKSSLARAGVLPMLVRPGVIDGIGLWRRAVMRPSEAAKDIFEGLATTLVAADGLPELVSDNGLSVADLARALREAPSGVPLLVKRCLAEIDREVQAREGLVRPPVGRLVILVDQFEEIFTQQDLFPPEICRRFVTALGELARSGIVWVLVTLRSEFFNRCEEIPELVALKGRKGQYQLLPPAEPQLRQIVRLPAIAAGLQFEVDSDGRSLDDVLVDSAGRHPGSLPLLELTLEELYKRRREDCWLTHDALDQVKGIEGALETGAENVFQKLPTEVAAEFDQVFRALVTVNLDEEAAFVRRIAYLDLLASTPSRRKLIDAFVEARLLVAGGDPGTRPILQVAHEALFLHWPRLEKLLDDNREFLRRRARAAIASNLWRTEQRNRSYLWWHGRLLGEARDLLAHAEDLTPAETEFARASVEAGSSARRNRLTATVIAAFIAVAAGVSGFLWWRNWHNEKEIAGLHEQLASVASSTNNAYEIGDLGRRILAKNPKDSEAWPIYCKALLDQSDYSGFNRAVEQWKRNILPPSPKILDLRGDSELKQGDEQSAVKLWSEYLRSPSINREAKLETWKKIAVAYAQLGQWENARSFLTEWIAAQDNIDARVLRAKANQQLRNWDAVREDINVAQKIDPTSPAIKGFGPIVRAEDINPLNDRIGKFPRDPLAWLARATHLTMDRHFQAALEDLDHAMNLDPDSPRLAIEKAHLLWQLRRPIPDELGARPSPEWTRDEARFPAAFAALESELNALTTLDARTKDETRNATRYMERGNALAHLGQYELAIRDFNRALQVDDHLIKALEYRAASYRAIGQAQRAEADLERAKDLQPQQPTTPP